MTAHTKEKLEAGTLSLSASPQAEAVTRSHRELVRRIVASPIFARSERLSALFNYVCAMALEGRAAELNEQAIGQAVFGRSPEYDASADGIVRTQASRLRQRLDLFFQQEGSQEPIEVVIPRGGYVPLFRLRQEAADASSMEPVEQGSLPVAEGRSAPQAPSSRNERLRMQLPWLLCLLLTATLVLMCYMSWRQGAHNAVSNHLLWGRMFRQDRPTLEVSGDSGLVLSYALGGPSLSLHDYLAGEYRVHDEVAGDARSTRAQALMTDLATRRYTAIVDLDVAVKLAQYAGIGHSNLDTKYARDVRPNDLKRGNVILIGAREANPWVELFEHNMNFVLQDDYPGKVFSVVNKQPQPGEQSHWDMSENDPLHRVYGVVAFLPNLSGNGEALVIEGTSMAGTEAAWDFVSDDAELLPFLNRVRRPDGSVPHFELLVETQNMSASAVHGTLVAWRVLDSTK